MMNDEKWTELQQAQDMAYFKADLCCYSPSRITLQSPRTKRVNNHLRPR